MKYEIIFFHFFEIALFQKLKFLFLSCQDIMNECCVLSTLSNFISHHWNDHLGFFLLIRIFQHNYHNLYLHIIYLNSFLLISLPSVQPVFLSIFTKMSFPLFPFISLFSIPFLRLLTCSLSYYLNKSCLLFDVYPPFCFLLTL